MNETDPSSCEIKGPVRPMERDNEIQPGVKGRKESIP
jgi:hypothetical protein